VYAIHDGPPLSSIVKGELVIAGIGNCCPVSAKSPAAGGSANAPVDPVTHIPPSSA